MKIYRKLILTYIFLAILPTSILCTFLINSIKGLTVSRALNDAVQSVEVIESEFRRNLTMLTDVSRQLYLNKNYLNLLDKQYENTWEAVSTYFLFKDFEALHKVYGNQIENIRIYVHNDTILENWYLNKITPAVMESTWYQTAVQNPSKVIWYPTVNENTFTGEKNCYSLVRLTGYPNTPSILLIDLNKTYINSLLDRAAYCNTTIFDEYGNVICTNSPEKVAEILEKYTFDSQTFGGPVRILDDKSDDGNYKTIVKDLSVEGVNGQFRIVSSFLLADILHESNTLLVRYILLAAFFIFVSSVLAFYATRGLKRRVTVLCSEMELVSKGDFTLTSTITGTDELGILSQSLNVMAANLKKLIEENYEANFQKQEMLLKHNDIKLRLLTNQMNPHFLFNTLESLRMEANLHNEPEISDIIQRLGGLLRKSIQAGSNELPLEEEIQFVEDYLCIQAFRYGDRVQYHFSISEESRKLRILPFLIQPIVENAIIHGLENNEDTGMIYVNSFVENDDLIIEVIDSGVGMTPEKLQEIRDSLDVEETDNLHIGIRNVHLRIRLRYGAPYGLQIESGENTKVTIRIPKVVKHV